MQFGFMGVFFGTQQHAFISSIIRDLSCQHCQLQYIQILPRGSHPHQFASDRFISYLLLRQPQGLKKSEVQCNYYVYFRLNKCDKSLHLAVDQTCKGSLIFSDILQYVSCNSPKCHPVNYLHLGLLDYGRQKYYSLLKCCLLGAWETWANLKVVKQGIKK